MHSGFKGTRLGISEMILKDGKINYELQFIDSEGVVHAIMRHTRPLGEDGPLTTKVDELVTLLLGEAAVMHFTSPAGSGDFGTAPSGGPDGIAEALGSTAAAPDEPEGTSG